MFKTENDVINWIYSFSTNRDERNLDHLHEFLASNRNPHLKIQTIHIAGTNGKGSTVSYIRQALMESGYKVGTFTSPFVTCFGERISIDGNPLREDNLIFHAEHLKQLLPEDTSEFTSFDILTLISFLHFDLCGVDVAIYETGIGGRLDATNVINPLATAITNVGHDHAEILGDTQLERAREKLGIVKAGIPLFTTEEDCELLMEFEKVCLEKGAKLHLALEEAQLLVNNETGVTFNWGRYENIQIGMYGEHQFKNAVLAVSILEHLRLMGGVVDPENVDPTAITNTRWQGRFEHIRTQKQPIILDGAHNIEGIQALIDTVKAVYPERDPVYMFSAIDTKDAKQMVQMLEESCRNVTITKGTHPKSIDPELLSTHLQYNSWFVEDYKEAIEDELAILKSNEVLIICGSLYFISDMRRFLLEEDGRFLL